MTEKPSLFGVQPKESKYADIKVQRIIFLYNTTKLQKLESLAEFEKFIHFYLGEKLPIGCKIEVMALTDLFQQVHISSEEKGGFKDNLDEKLQEFVLAVIKLAGGTQPENIESLDRHMLYHLGVTEEDVLSGRVLVVGMGEDSGIVKKQLDNKLIQMIEKNPEAFGEDAPLVKGLLEDSQIMRAMLAQEFPGVETSPVIQALGSEAYARMVKVYGERNGFNVSPKTASDLANAIEVEQKSFLSWFLWRPGMKLDPNDLTSLKSRQASSVSMGYFTAQDLGKQEEFDIESIIIPSGVDYSQYSEMPTEKSLGYPYNGPLSRYDCYAEMLNSLLTREFFLESFGNKAKYTKPTRPQILNEWANGYEPENYNIVLVGNPIDGANSTLSQSALKYNLREGFKLNTVTPDKLYNPEKSAFLNFEGISRQIIKPNDAWVFGAFDPKTITREQKIMLYGAIFESIVSKSISPEHKNRFLGLLNEGGCYDEFYSILVKMYNMGALADAPSRIIKLINNPHHGNITEEIRKHSGSYFKVDIYGKSHPSDEIETYPKLNLAEGEYGVTGLFSAGLRGYYLTKERNLAYSLAQSGFTGVWGLGDKPGSMGGFYKGFMDHATDQGLKNPRLIGSSTRDIVTAETYSGKGVMGVDGTIFEGLAPRSFHITQSQGSYTSSGGAGTGYEIMVQLLDIEQRKNLKIYTSHREDDPIIALLKAVEGVSPEKPSNDQNIQFIIGSGRDVNRRIVAMFEQDRAAKFPEKWGREGIKAV